MLLRMMQRRSLFCEGGYCFLYVSEKPVCFFDFEKSAILVFSEYTAMMGTWIFISCYIAKGLKCFSLWKEKRDPA